MSTKFLNDGWYVVDEDGTEFDGPYLAKAEAELAADYIAHPDHEIEG